MKAHSSNPTKITCVIGSLATGGAEVQLLELLRRLDPARWKTYLVLLNGKHAERAPERVCEVISLDIPDNGTSRFYPKAWKAAQALKRLTECLCRIRPDVVHALLPQACILAAPAVRLARRPVLIGNRLSLTGCYRKRNLLAVADRVATRMCDYMLANCLAITQELVHLDGIPPDHVATIYYGVDTLRFKPGDRALRQLYGWNDDDVVFGIVANFIPYKRHIDFIRAAKLITAKNPCARFVMAGEDRGILSGLRREIAEAGLESRFVIIQGTSKPEKLYSAIDAYICTSETEGFSNVLLEASASGLPLIATRVGGNPEIVVPGKNGFIVQVATPEEIAAAALALAENSLLRKTLGVRSRQLVEECFSLEKMVQQHELLYERALESRRAGVAARG